MTTKKAPSMDAWLAEAKTAEKASECGMYLFHNGVVRQSAKAKVRNGMADAEDVSGMLFDYDAQKVEQAVQDTYRMPGIQYIRVWLNRGRLAVGENLMMVLVGGDIRPHVIDALNALVSELKEHCVTETELHG